VDHFQAFLARNENVFCMSEWETYEQRKTYYVSLRRQNLHLNDSHTFIRFPIFWNNIHKKPKSKPQQNTQYSIT